MRKRILSVTIHDCDVQTFHAGGNGGQNQNTRDTGVRVIHRPSGAVGESREERSQLQNKRAAFGRMARTIKFKVWVNSEVSRETPEQWVELQMKPNKLKIEVRDANGWIDEERDLAGSGG